MNQPLVSVVIPFYNAEKYLIDSILSVVKQTYNNLEIILLNDGSSDASLDIALSFNDSRIKVISDGKNLGLPARLNQMTSITNGDFIARMDADDLIPLDRIEKQLIYLEGNKAKDLVTMRMLYITNDYKVTSKSTYDARSRSTEDLLYGDSGICHATLLVRREWYERNKYDPAMERVEDYELWLRTGFNNDLSVGYMDEIGYFYRSDVTLSLKKYLVTFSSLRVMVLNIKVPFLLKVKFMLKSYFKSLVVFIIFNLGVQNKFLSKNNYNRSLEYEQTLLDGLLEDIHKRI